MRRIFLLILPLFALAGCEKQNFLRLSSHEETKEYIPTYLSTKSFRSNEGDTIFMRKLSSSNYYEKSTATGGDYGNLGDLDYIEVERTKLIIGSDTPYFRINFDLVTSYNASQITNGEDRLTFILDEENNPATQKLEFSYTDTLNCLTADCAYSDTLKLQLKTFYKVYYNPRSSSSFPALYINKTKGLVGFKTSNNKIYELISN